MKKVNQILSVLIVSVCISSVAWAKIAVYSAQKVVDTIEEGKKARAKMETVMTELSSLEKNLKNMENDMIAKQEEFGKMRLAWDKKVLEQKQNAIINSQKNMQTKFAEYQKKRAQVENQELEFRAEIGKKIQEVIKKIATTGSYELILEELEGGVHYVKPSMNITDLVIKEYNKVHKK